MLRGAGFNKAVANGSYRLVVATARLAMKCPGLFRPFPPKN